LHVDRWMCSWSWKIMGVSIFRGICILPVCPRWIIMNRILRQWRLTSSPEGFVANLKVVCLVPWTNERLLDYHFGHFGHFGWVVVETSKGDFGDTFFPKYSQEMANFLQEMRVQSLTENAEGRKALWRSYLAWSKQTPNSLQVETRRLLPESPRNWVPTEEHWM
jgi:hypothetical protein